MSLENNNDALQFEAPSLEKVASLLPAYTFESLIAKGGMGAVYKATQSSLDRPVAIKVLPTEFGDDEDFRSSFQSEAKLMAKLNHPNLISIYDFGEIEGMLYIVMELVEGESLYEKTYKKAIKQETALRLVRDISRGLEHAHAAGILHRDIKPANILLKDKQPKIGDFGLSRPTGNAETGVIFGTPGYIAPEVVANPAAVDQRTDIYSVGIILYELITGERPGTTYIPVTDIVECHPTVDAIIRKSIQPDINKRFANAEELEEKIDDLLRDLKNAPASPASRLLTASNKPKTPALKLASASKATPAPVPVRPAAKLKTSPVAVKPAANLATPAVDATPRPKSPTKPIAVNTSGESVVIRNIIIIIILLVAIYVTHSILTQKQKDTELADAQARAEYAQVKKEQEAIRAAKKEEIRLQRENNTPDRRPNKPLPTEITETPKKTTLEILDDLRSELSSGARPEKLMPEGTFMLTGNTRMLLLVDTPMNWHQADRFARKHGAYLATLRNTTDTTTVSSKIPSGTTAWLGAGTSGGKQWSWADGTPEVEAVELGRISKHRFITLGDDAYPTPTKPLEQHPFVLEWRMDGTNPGTIKDRLLLTRQTLSQVNPIYPPGSVDFGSRHFFLVPSKTTLQQARELADIGGARLHVPSDEQEIDFVANFITSTLPKNKKAWIGGLKKGQIWTWISGEPWQSANWDDNYPQDHHGLAITSKANAPWQDAPTTETLDYVLLEWSIDKPKIATDTLKTDGNSSNASLANLISKAKTIADTQNKDREEKHAENIKRLIWDIDFHYKGLARNEKAAQLQDLEDLKAMLDGKDRVPGAMANLGPVAKVQTMTAYAVNKQDRIESDFKQDIEKIRIAYIAQLEALAEDLRKKGQTSAHQAVKTEITDSGKTPSGFIEHFGL